MMWTLVLLGLLAAVSGAGGAADLNRTFECCSQLSPVFQLWWNKLQESSRSLDFALSARVPGDRWLGFGPAAVGVTKSLMVRLDHRLHRQHLLQP
jgi:hypothetical protein